tara:strand:+ start:11636 stop:12928 length:1293 start_codon:yes stop_codon:yes gene_type:complete
MNEYDSNRILDLTKRIGYEKTNNIEECNCYIINTCHIREKATDKVYHDVGRLKKKFNNKKKPILIIAGCVAQAEGEIILKKEKFIDAVIGPQSYHEITKIIKEIELKNKKLNYTEFDVISKFDHLNLVENTNTKISTFLTIQEGCDKFCKFCVVPYTRGPEHSRSFKEIIAEANQLVLNGSKEIILLGQNVNAYHSDNKKLSDLIYELNKIKGLKRIRYTTSHPKDMTDDLIEAYKKCDKLMPLLHLPVQSGSSKILEAMNRKHDLYEYLRIIEKLKKTKKNIKFSSDFIIAYPGETEGDFKETLNLLEKIKFINTYSFVFSSRPGTPSSNLKIIDQKIAKQRLLKFQDLSSEIKKNYRKNLLNSKIKVLFESETSNKNTYFGRDEYSNSVIVNNSENLIGEVKNVMINEFNQTTLFGEVISENKNYVAA